MEMKSQNTGVHNLLIPKAEVCEQNYPHPASTDSTSQTGFPDTADWQEETYQKIKAMKEMYFPELNELYQKVCLKIQQHDSLALLPKEQIDRLKMMKVFLERVIPFLQGSKSNISIAYRDKMGNYEKQIVSFLNLHRPVKLASSYQGKQLLHPSAGHTPSMLPQQQPQSQNPQRQQHDEKMNPQMQPMNIQNIVTPVQPSPLTCLLSNFVPHLSDAGTADWQEQAYQKVKAMKEMYFPELDALYKKVCLKLQQQDFLAQLPKDQVESLKMMRTFLWRVITFLQGSKANIPISYRDKMDSYEKQIVSFLNLHRGVKKPTAPHQGQQQIQSSGGHTLSMPQQQQLKNMPQQQIQSNMQPLILQQQQLILQHRGVKKLTPHQGQQQLESSLSGSQPVMLQQREQLLLQQLKFQDHRHQMQQQQLILQQQQQLILQQQQLILQQQKQIASLMALQKGMEPASSHPGEQ